MTPIEQPSEPICKYCREVFSLRSGMELTDYCDPCAQALVKVLNYENKRLREALEKMLHKAYKQDWNEHYPEEVALARQALTKPT